MHRALNLTVMLIDAQGSNIHLHSCNSLVSGMCMCVCVFTATSINVAGKPTRQDCKVTWVIY